MRILCIGRHGQLARALSERAVQSNIILTALGRTDLDILQPRSLSRQIDAVKPDMLINASAYTAVDAAETDVNAAKALNEDALGTLATTAARNSLPIIHYSTDYVFDGTNRIPYTETDQVNPRTVYGKTKLAGEQILKQHARDFLIFRTAWVYSPFGKNFVKTMLRLAETREEVSVVCDQLGNPSNAFDLADATLKVCEGVFNGEYQSPWGLYHMVGSGSASWAEVAEAVFNTSAKHNHPTAIVKPISSDNYPTPAKRPANSRLSCEKLSSTFGISLPRWQESLEPTIARILSGGDQAI